MKKFSLFFGLLFVLQTASWAQDTLPAPTSYRVNKVSFNMVRVEQGGFWMGAQHMDTAEFNYDRMSQSDELPVHYVAMKADYSPPGSAIPRILQARILEWVAIAVSNA